MLKKFIDELGSFNIGFANERLDYLNHIYNKKETINLFALGLLAKTISTQGVAKIDNHTAIVFPVENRLTSVLAHETLHSLGLTHTHYDNLEDEKDEEIKNLILNNRKQIYKTYTTNNVMAYVQEYRTPKNMADYEDNTK